jgi:hypothetical protein
MLDHPLDGARKRVERADKHFRDFMNLVDTYAASEANNIRVEYDEIRDQPNFILAPKTPRPDELALIVSDCIHNLRAALDYIVYELAKLDSGLPDPNGTQFPITVEDKFVEHRKARLKGKGPFAHLTDAHVDAIEAYQPYKGFNWTETLRDISNPDKHRELIRHKSGRRLHLGAPGRTRETFKGVGPGRSDVELERRVAFRVFFSDGRPVIETLEVIKREVALVIDSFSPEFKV